MKRIIALFLSLIVIVCSCKKKDKLEGDKEILVGQWTWLKTNHSYGWCLNETLSEVITPTDLGDNFSIQFLSKGKIKLLKNGNLIHTYKITFDIFEYDTTDYCSINNSYQFYMTLRSSSANDYFWGCVNQDTIGCSNLSFPFETQEGCESYWNYFVRKN